MSKLSDSLRDASQDAINPDDYIEAADKIDQLERELAQTKEQLSEAHTDFENLELAYQSALSRILGLEARREHAEKSEAQVKMPKLNDYKPEIETIKANGFEIVETIINDWGHTIRLHVRKNNKDNIISLRECFYDTDDSREVTIFHGVIDIRETPWSKKIRGISV